MSIRILLADDHLIVRKGLASLLDDETDFEIVAEASNGTEAITLEAETQPDVAILDLRLPDMTGIDAARHILNKKPDSKILILTSFVKEADVRLAFDSGVLAYVSKEAGSEELLSAIVEVAKGRKHIPLEMSLILARTSGKSSLSQRELEILRLIAKGHSNKEIGSQLSVPENTVKNHVKSILSKLEAKDRTHAVSEALKSGLFRLDDKS